MALKLKGSTSGFVAIDAPSVAGNNTLILPENTGSAQQLLGNDITAGVTTFTRVTVNRNGDLTVPGTISIGGTLTYEDVTSVDSVGIITARSTIDAQGDLSIADKIIHTGDTNTAIRFPAADTFTVETDGTERMRITSTGQLGVGVQGAAGNNKIHARLADSSIATPSTASVLLVENNTNAWITIGSGASNYGGILFGDSGSSDIGQVRYDHSNNRLEFHTNSSEKMRIDSNGHVNIGTGTAEEKLTIRDTTQHCLIRIISGNGSGQSAGIDFGDSDDTDIARIRYYHDSNYMRFDVNAAERLRIDSSGNLLLGTTSSAGRLCVQGAAGGVALQTTDATNSTFRISHPSAAVTLLAGGSSQHLALGTGFAEKMRIDSSGRLLIGKISGTTKVDVDATNSTIRVTKAAASNYCGFQLDRDNSGTEGGFLGLSGAANHYINGSVQHDICLRSQSNLLFSAGGTTERMRIASDGEVFIGEGFGNTNRSTLLSISGTYQEAGGALAHMGIYSSDSYAQDKGGSILFGGQDGSVAKQYFAGIKGAKVNSTSGNYAGYMAFYTRPDGSTPAERMRLDEAGRIGMGVNPSHGRVQSSPISFNPFGNTWLSGASYVAAGGYGGGFSLLDGSKGYSISCYDNGNDLYVFPHSSTTAAGSGGVYINNAGTSWQSASDERDKENLVNITDAITKVKTLRTVIGNYIWKPEVKTPFLIAQDVQAVLPEAVTIRNKNVEGEEERLGMSYQNVIPLVTAALKEAIAEIETLKAKVAALEGS